MKLLRYKKDGHMRRLILCGVKFSWKVKRTPQGVKQLFCNRYFTELGYTNSLKVGACVDKKGNPLPWYTYPAIEYLSQFDYSDKLIFEYGSGNSTLWWANRAKEVIAVENNKAWYDSRLNLKPDNTTMLYEENQENYAKSIAKQGKIFDVIIIDGYWRDLCAANIKSFIKDDGLIIFDNSDRVPEFEEYKKCVNYLKELNFVQADFYGAGPLNEYCWCTSVFISPKFAFKTIKGGQPHKGVCGISEI